MNFTGLGSLLVTRRELKVLIDALDYAVMCAESEYEGLSSPDGHDSHNAKISYRQWRRFKKLREALNQEPRA